MDAAQFLRPTSLAEALNALATPGVCILAGGTDFYPAQGERPIAEPVLDVTAIPELRGIAIGRDEIRIGGGTSWSTIIATPLPTCFDALKQAAREVGSVQIQNRGTVAGNLCNASPAADGVPPLLALDALVELVSRSGARRLALADFIVGNRRTERRSDEILAAIVLPRSIDGPSCFLKLGARRYLVISIAMVAAILERDGKGRIAQARVAVGACSAVALRLHELERDLVGKPCAAGIGELVMPQHLAALPPIDDVRATAAYRIDAARTLIGRALDRCTGEIAR
ncbi:MAG: xanthine dehydrogenase family protein subunit M [Dongiaceae bacterium]